jgi:hypothetical protein
MQIRQLVLLLLVIVACANWNRWYPANYSILGVQLGDSKVDLLKRFPQPKVVPFLPTAGGEGRISNSLMKYGPCLELAPGLTVAFGPDGRAQAITGKQLESWGIVILDEQNRAQAPDILGEPISGSSSDATYFSYSGGIVTRSTIGEFSICLHE